MNRKYWEPKENYKKGEQKHCGNCANSFLLKKQRHSVTCKGIPIVEELSERKVMVTSTCSGLSNIYDKVVIKMDNEEENEE